MVRRWRNGVQAPPSCAHILSFFFLRIHTPRQKSGKKKVSRKVDGPVTWDDTRLFC